MDVPPDQNTLLEVVEVVGSGDADRFNDRICHGSFYIEPLASLGPEYTGTALVAIGQYEFIGGKNAGAALRPPGSQATLVIELHVESSTGGWCAYSTVWCPTSYPGLAPFIGTGRYDDEPSMLELQQRTVCAHVSG